MVYTLRMSDTRQNFRLRKQMDVMWSIPEQNLTGTGKIFNVSLTGILFETDKLFTPSHGMVIHFSMPGVRMFPPSGKLKWFKRTGDEAHPTYQCGVRFPFPSPPSWNNWMEENILKLADAQDNAILTRYLS
jgi:hypothetical protein